MTVGQAVEPRSQPREVGQKLRADKKSSAQRSARRWEAIQGYGFLFPALVLFLLFHLLPVFYALFLSLFDARVFRDLWSPGPFIGACRYVRALAHRPFRPRL